MLPAASSETRVQALRASLLSWPFALSVVTLLTNDFVFKRAWPGLVTGKLSDVAGIAIVTLLALAAWPQRSARVFTAIAAVFAWWKSPLSQPFIDAMNTWLPFPMSRTVDYTDLAALAIMPCCAYVIAHRERFAIRGAALRRLLVAPLFAATLAGLVATTMVPQFEEYQFRLTASAQADLDRAAVVEQINRVMKGYGLKCLECADPLTTGKYGGDNSHLEYTFPDSRTVHFEVQTIADGLFLGEGPQEKSAEILRDLRKLLNRRFPELQFDMLHQGREKERRPNPQADPGAG